jgi:hypothetical protein
LVPFARNHQKNVELKALNLDKLSIHCPQIDPIQCGFYAQGAIVALENQGHSSGVQLIVDGDNPNQCLIKWNSTPIKGGWKEGRDSTQFGALAIAFSLITSLTEYTVVEQSPIGTGFDYYLGFKEDDPRFDPDNFMNARLEVSGIAIGTTSEIASRIRDKMKQTNKSDSWNLPAYVSVTAFGKPISFLRKK